MKVGRIASVYRWIEYLAFGRALERSRFAFLDRLRGARQVLVLGEGDGRAVARLATVAPLAQIDVYEVSAEMIALASARVGGNPRVRFHCQDARHAGWSGGTYDGIVTLFFLDCFLEAEVTELVRGLAQVLRPGGLWLMTDFAVPDSGWRRWHARVWIAVMYFFFRLTTGLRARRLPAIEAALREAGLGRVEGRERRAGMIRSEIWSADI